MFVIGEAVVEDDVKNASFCCDLQACRGACCTLPGGRGAPLEDDETLEIDKAFPAARKFLSDRSRSFIESHGMFDGTPGDFATTCIEIANACSSSSRTASPGALRTGVSRRA